MALAGCASSFTTPAAVSIDKGPVLIGTTTASTSGGSFEVSDAASGLRCNGTYDPFDKAVTISAPFSCSDGRTGTVTVMRTPDRLAGNGIVQMSDGTKGSVAFGRLATSVINTAPPQPSGMAQSAPPPKRASVNSAATNAIIDAWKACAFATTKRVFSSRATASELAVAALSGCYRYEMQLQGQLQAEGFNSSDASYIVGAARKTLEERIVLIVLDARRPSATSKPKAHEPAPAAPKADERSA